MSFGGYFNCPIAPYSNRCHDGVREAEVISLELWQGCGKNPDFTAKTDIIDKSLLN
jgi:hypothetical protein